MTATVLMLTPRDPIIARDGRPFGVGQGRRMHGVSWPLPSVVAGSFRTALVKANPDLDFSRDMPERLKQAEVAGVFPVADDRLYLPAPIDAVAQPSERGNIKAVHAATPQECSGGCDFPDGAALQPVMLPDNVADFKPCEVPAWWPVDKLETWLTETKVDFDQQFLEAPLRETRDHVCLDSERGAAAEGLIFTTVALNISHLPRFGVPASAGFERFARVSLSARVVADGFAHLEQLDLWHPLGGERRMVHWRAGGDPSLWQCPPRLRKALEDAKCIRMVLATPAIFTHGWRPGWLNGQLEGSPPGLEPLQLRLVGVINHRWQAISGWSLAPPVGPKRIRRMVPAGSVYFFEKVEGPSSALADSGWLRPVSDDEQERRDGFGLAVWGVW